MLLVMAVTHTGYLPVPGAGGAITLMHIPVILAGILSGPIAGAGLGLIFAISSVYDVEPHDWLVQGLPRILIGLVSSIVFLSARYYATPESRATLGSAVAALAGSLTNTMGVTLLALAKGLYPINEMVSVALIHGSIEAFLAVIITLPVAVSIHHHPN